MILRDQPNQWEIFLIVKGSIVPRILPNIVGAALWALIVLLLDQFVGWIPRVSIGVMGVFGLSLSLFLGFRNNAAYDRWWEARKIWGKMVADVRSFAQELRIFSNSREDDAFILTHLLAFHHLHRGQLRGDDVRDDVTRWVGEDEAEPLIEDINAPNAALRAISVRLRDMAEAGKLDGFGQKALAERLACFPAAQAGNERLLTTPLPFVYSLLVWRTTYLYCLLLPFALLDSAGWFEPLVAAVVAYVFFGLAQVTHELEHPFRDKAAGIPLSALCRVMEISVCNALNRPAPSPLTPTNYVLE